MRIKLTTLKDCNRCNKLKQLLKESNIDFSFTTCEDDPINCDNLEAITNTVSYPMTLLVDTDDNILKIIYIVDNYDELGKVNHLGNGIEGIPFYSVEQVVQYVKNRLH